MPDKCHFCKHDLPITFRTDVCATCHHFSNFQLKERMTPRAAYEYEKLEQDEEWTNDRSVPFDRNTALMVLRDLSNRMYPSNDIFGDKTLVIRREYFEQVRKKYLDKKEQV